MTDISIEMIIESIRNVSNRDIAEDTDIFSSGVDSLAVLRCRALLRAQTGVKVPGHVFFRGRTPVGIVKLLEAENADR